MAEVEPLTTNPEQHVPASAGELHDFRNSLIYTHNVINSGSSTGAESVASMPALPAQFGGSYCWEIRLIADDDVTQLKITQRIPVEEGFMELVELYFLEGRQPGVDTCAYVKTTQTVSKAGIPLSKPMMSSDSIRADECIALTQRLHAVATAQIEAGNRSAKRSYDVFDKIHGWMSRMFGPEEQADRKR